MNFKKKIIWLASYPKSGNTWFRAFLSALMNNGRLNINNLSTDGIFSSRRFLNYYTDIDSTLLTDIEVRELLPEVFNAFSLENGKEKFYIKIHDAYGLNNIGLPIVPNESTHCAIYIIRNPLDIVGSLASHNSSSIDEAIKMMNSKKSSLTYQEDNNNTASQTKQLLYDWSGHVNSWMSGPNFPVYFIRYEDLKSDPLKYFSETIQKAGLYFSEDNVKTAIKASQFEVLRDQEKKTGFNEKTIHSKMFFRKGESGSWKKELSEKQILNIVTHHQKVMKLFKYLD